MNKFPSVAAVLCVALMFFFQGCDDESKTPVNYFTLNVDSKYTGFASEYWVLIHGKNGEPLAAKKFLGADVLTFETITPPEMFSVTMVQSRGALGYTLQTFHGVDQGESWVLSGPNSIDRGTNLPNINVRVSDAQLGSPYDATYSDGSGFHFPSSLSSTNFEVNFSPYTNLKYFISVVDKTGTPKYKFLQQAPTASLNYTLADFSSFDKQSVFTFPVAKNFFSFTIGLPNTVEFYLSEGYMTNLRNSSNTASPINHSSTTLGYVNLFSKYFTFLNVSYGGYDLMYRAYGGAPASMVNITDNITASVSNKTWNGFAISLTDFSWFTSNWKSVINPSSSNPMFQYWSISSADTSFKNPTAFPSEFSSAHPDLKIEDFVYRGSEIVKSSRTFDDFVLNNYRGDLSQSYEDLIKVTYQ